MIYLASPYTDVLPEKMQERYELARDATAHLLARCIWVYSPIVHCHDLAVAATLPRTFDFWAEYNFHMLARADKLVVLEIPGWAVSVGVGAEIAFWRTVKGKPLYLASPNDCKAGNLDRVPA